MASTGDHDPAAADSEKQLKTFRDQIHALGAFWIIIGLLAGGVSLYGMLRNPELAARVGGFVTVALGVIWIVIGILTCLKHMWAVYVGLGLSYLSLVGNAMNRSLFAVGILVLVILQAHRVLKLAKEMAAGGLPPTSQP